jgi:hypothetical protein
MLPREILVWRTWYRTNADRFDRYFYNMRVGQGTDPGEGYSKEARRGALLASRKRIDVVGWKLGHATLIEVEDNPGLSNFGQIAGYETLWREFVRQGGLTPLDYELGVEKFYPTDMPLDLHPALMVVCARIGVDARLVLERGGVTVEVVPTDFSELRPK